jgi:hypothetical protein
MRPSFRFFRALSGALLIAALFLFCLPAKAQDTTTISCEALMDMPLLEFNLAELPDGFLECMDGHPADALMIRKYAKILSANQGDDFTVAEMKAVLDSVDAVEHYRANHDLVQGCLLRYKQPLDPYDWPGDSLAMRNCGMDPEAIAVMGYMVRDSLIPHGKPLQYLIGRYNKMLPELLAEKAPEWQAVWANPDNPMSKRADRTLGPGLKAFAHPADALDCALDAELPVLFVLGGWAHNRTDYFESSVLTDWVLFRRLAQETVPLFVYADDPRPLPEGITYFSQRLDTTVQTHGQLARDWALRLMDIQHPLGFALLSPEGEVLATHIGSITRFKLEDMLAAAKAEE